MAQIRCAAVLANLARIAWRFPALVPEDLRNGASELLSWQRALCASAIACGQRRNPSTVLREIYPGDARAMQIGSPLRFRSTLPERSRVP